MIICDNDHDEIVFSGYKQSDCPLCTTIQEKDSEIMALEKEISELESEIEDLKS